MTERQRGPRQHYKTVYETRTFLSFHVGEEVLRAVLPTGWSLSTDDDGAHRGSNVRFGFSDQLAAANARRAKTVARPMGTRAGRVIPLRANVRRGRAA